MERWQVAVVDGHVRVLAVVEGAQEGDEELWRHDRLRNEHAQVVVVALQWACAADAPVNREAVLGDTNHVVVVD